MIYAKKLRTSNVILIFLPIALKKKTQKPPNIFTDFKNFIVSIFNVWHVFTLKQK